MSWKKKEAERAALLATLPKDYTIGIWPRVSLTTRLEKHFGVLPRHEINRRLSAKK
jgi:hypothetical protein